MLFPMFIIEDMTKWREADYYILLELSIIIIILKVP